MKKGLDWLAAASRAELAERWHQAFGHPPPKKCHAELLRQVLAWHLQAQTGGGLSATERRQLAGQPPSVARELATGTRLVRVWQGQTHQVMVLGDGFLHAGRRYTSLSAIAKAITGTAWSGPVFFGLKKR